MNKNNHKSLDPKMAIDYLSVPLSLVGGRQGESWIPEERGGGTGMPADGIQLLSSFKLLEEHLCFTYPVELH